MLTTIDLADADLAEVQRILARHAPGYEVRAFGSRVSGGARQFSDLDLALCGKGPAPSALLETLRDEFAESDLPISVDVLDWQALSPAFRETLGDRFLVVQSGPAAAQQEARP